MYGRDTGRNYTDNYNNYGNRGGNNNRSGQKRNHTIPNEPPFTAYIGNAPDTMVQGDFERQLFAGLKVKQVRLVRDRQTDRFRGFAYVDFEDADSLRNAIALDGTRVNDQPIRIDVANRPLGATKAEGFRNKPAFESSSTTRTNNNRSDSRFHQNEREDGNQRSAYQENGYNEGHSWQEKSNNQGDSRKTSEKQSESRKEQLSSTIRKTSDDVFNAPDTPISNNDEHGQDFNNEDETTTITRQLSRNWADCPIDESVPDTPSSPIINNTSTSDDVDDFQLVRGKPGKSRSNQYPSSRTMGNQPMRGRNGGNYSRGMTSSQISTNEGSYYDQTSPTYSNRSPTYYQQYNSQNSRRTGGSYNDHRPQQQQQQSSGSQQRFNSNRAHNNRDDPSNRSEKHSASSTSNSSHDIDSNTTSTENRPRLQLLPRSQKPSSSTNENPISESAARNANIFGCGKPRDERDPKIAELNKHIEEIVEKEQVPRTSSSDEPTSGITMPVRILSAKSES